MPNKKNIVIAISGASGAIYAKTLLLHLETIQSQIDKVAVILSDNAYQIWEDELQTPFSSSFQIYKNNDFSAPFASGSGVYDTMIIVPCSMGTLGRIANGISSDLISRTADVFLKERRSLILVTRETPLSLIHIENMRRITLAGGIIFPANPSYYHHPKDIEELVQQFTFRLLDFAGFSVEGFRWGN
jgi:4-hydroxy-3-polyprenylbenzoate decarboxylase